MKNLIFILAGLCFFSLSSAQIGIGQWETFQTYGFGTSVAVAGTKVYCGTQQGLYSYDSNTNELEEYTKPGGYVGLGVTALGYSTKLNALIVAYDDANLDILKNNEIVNLPQIKNYSLTGDKKIYNITISGDSAILSCGFGVVVVDMRQEIIKTDVKFSDDIGFAGEVCYDAAIMNGYYYFATSQGMYKVLYNSNIKDLGNWNLMTGLPAGTFNNVVNHNDSLYFNFSNYLTNALDNLDVLYSSDGTTSHVYQAGWNVRIMDIASNNGKLGLLAVDRAMIMDLSGNPYYTIPPGCVTRSERIDIDAVGVGRSWIAYTGDGMLSYEPTTCSIHAKDGPFSKNVWDMQFVNGDIWVAAGGVNVNDGNVYIADKMYYRKKGDWKWCDIPDYGHGIPVDIHTLAVEPNNPGHVYGGSWGTGLYEIVNYLPSAQYLTPDVDSSDLGPLAYKIGGMALDSKNNLWFSNSNLGSNQLKKKLATGGFAAPISLNTINSTNVITKVAIDNKDQVWVAVHGRGIVVFNPGTGQQKILTSTYNQGDLPQLSVRAMECDKDGQMWVGTHDGIRIFSPSQVFGSTINGQKIVIKDDNGINELLLKETIINDIEADGANRKWIATMGTGVRLVSDDGREIIYSFTAENSPLLSNNVNCIAIDDQSGEVCFGTDKGICCFRAEATASTDQFGKVYAYPNPVKPGYDGPIAITGMATNSIVKITDIAGNIVFETTSDGGQAIWSGKKYDGKRPSTGVYLVFCVNEDASQTVVTKILFIN
jgi:hypothetical protein